VATGAVVGGMGVAEGAGIVAGAAVSVAAATPAPVAEGVNVTRYGVGLELKPQPAIVVEAKQNRIRLRIILQ
jgi:hypothetical protein